MTLKNGTRLIQAKPARNGGYIVLADCGVDRYHRYATWWADPQWNTYHGHYCETLKEAAADFINRR